MCCTLLFLARSTEENRADKRPSLGRNVLAMIETAKNALFSYKEEKDGYDVDSMGISPEDFIVAVEPLAAFYIGREIDCLRKLKQKAFFVGKEVEPGTYASRCPTVDPYGSDGFECRLCQGELFNSYAHCDGCEEKGDDFNLCLLCVESRLSRNSDQRQKRKTQLMLLKKNVCLGGLDAKNEAHCSGKHTDYSLHTRFYTVEDLSALLKDLRKVSEAASKVKRPSRWTTQDVRKCLEDAYRHEKDTTLLMD